MRLVPKAIRNFFCTHRNTWQDEEKCIHCTDCGKEQMVLVGQPSNRVIVIWANPAEAPDGAARVIVKIR